MSIIISKSLYLCNNYDSTFQIANTLTKLAIY